MLDPLEFLDELTAALKMIDEGQQNSYAPNTNGSAKQDYKQMLGSLDPKEEKNARMGNPGLN